jgi:F-type H+-transporting ATPase subunit delta
MIEGSLSRRYSKAFFQLAQEEGREETVGIEIEQFLAAYRGSSLQSVLSNPAFSPESRKKILVEVAKQLQLSPVSRQFLALLLERDRLTYLPSIAASYRRLLNALKGRVEAKVVAAGTLEPVVVERLRETLRVLSGKEVVLSQETNPDLIGGLRVELEGKVYDGSVKTELEKMRWRLAREH